MVIRIFVKSRFALRDILSKDSNLTSFVLSECH